MADPVARLRYLSRATVRDSNSRRRLPFLLLTVFLPLQMISHPRAHNRPDARLLRPSAATVDAGTPNVWLVEKTGDCEVYSNGLRIENRQTVANEPRFYYLIDRRRPEPAGWLRRTVPAGIVFHTTESQQAPFEPGENRHLKYIGESLLLYLRGRRSYHFLVDRFGRVHRVVGEGDSANHAGRSVWADERWLYINLNDSFLGVAFEAQAGQDPLPVNQAQVYAGRVLTEMLRSKYHIAPGNCVTHAQVSVNPDNMEVGYHTDWGANFPYQRMGLTDNYTRLLPGMCIFGFSYSPTYLKYTGAPLWRALALAEEQVREAAAAHGLAVAEYRRKLQQQYRETIAALKVQGAQKENEHESE